MVFKTSSMLPYPKLNLWLNPEDFGLVNDVAANKFLRVIQVGLIAEQVAQHLNFEDLKAVTLASRDCLRCFRNTRAFTDKAVFIVGERNVDPYSYLLDDDADSEEEDDDDVYKYEDNWDTFKCGVGWPWLREYSSYRLPQHYSPSPYQQNPWNTELERDLQQFSKLSEIFRIYKEEVEIDVTLKSIHVLKASNFPWKNIAIQLGVDADVCPRLDLIANFLEAAESISIGFLPYEMITKFDSNGEEMAFSVDENVGFVVDEIFEYIKCNENLRELKLDARLMTNECLYFDLMQLEPVAAQIHSFSIYNEPFFENYFSSYCINYNMIGKISQLARLLPLTRIKKLSIGKIILRTYNSVEKKSAVNGILKIVECCKDTLEELELHLRFWREMIKPIHLSKLEHFNFLLSRRCRFISISDDDVKWELKGAEEFLKNNPPLEPLSMEIENLHLWTSWVKEVLYWM